MNRKILYSMLVCCALPLMVGAQVKEGHTHTGQLTGQAPFPVKTYVELANPIASNAAAWKGVDRPIIGWGTTDMRYAKEKPVALAQVKKKLYLKGWRGERVSAQWILTTPQKIDAVNVVVSPLRTKRKQQTIDKQQITAAFVRSVMTDELNPNGGGCGDRHNYAQFDSSLVADVLDPYALTLDVDKNQTLGGWVQIDIPQDAAAGVYRGVIEIKAGENILQRLPYSVEVKDRLLPRPTQWKFHLDLWQNPFAVARYHQVPLWSKEHFDLLRPIMEMYRDAGGKVITASIMERPWNGQTYDVFHSMITWVKRVDGSWTFDYDVFDRWVGFCRSLGLKQINCYTMIPWHLAFPYLDQATNTMQQIKTAPGKPEYAAMWTAMLKDFAKHLKAKGWFNDAYISMDERPMEAMKAALSVIHQSDKDWKVALAGNLHKELVDELNDYCLPMRERFSEEQMRERREKGMITTFYTCCVESKPNTFTFSAPAEAEWLSWYAAAMDLDGYLRWALNSWTIEPLLDSRFYTWAAGDTYLIYPGVRSSVRFERLREGIESFEKLQILKREWQKKGNHKALKELQELLQQFNVETLEQQSAAEMVGKANQWLNRW